jgi:hypothetical protein
LTLQSDVYLSTTPLILLSLPDLDPVVTDEPVRWAMSRLVKALSRQGFAAVCIIMPQKHDTKDADPSAVFLKRKALPPKHFHRG